MSFDLKLNDDFNEKRSQQFDNLIFIKVIKRATIYQERHVCILASAFIRIHHKCVGEIE